MEGPNFVGEGGYGIRSAETVKGATLVWVEKAGLSCQSGESDGKDAFKDFRNGLKKDNNEEGGRGVIGWFSGFIQDNSVRMFERGGVVPKGN